MAEKIENEEEEKADEKIAALMDTGLTLNEAKVYLALTENPVSNIVKIAHASRVHRVNVYDAIEKLKQKGLVNVITVDKKKKFQAADPHMLMTIMEEKSSRLNRIIPQLELAKCLMEPEAQVCMYEGFSALKNIFYGFLKSADERVVYGVPKIASDLFSDFFGKYHKRRIAMKKRMRHIYNSDAKERMKFLNSLPFTEARYLDPQYDSPVATSICGEQVVLTLWSKNPVSIVIVNSQIANAYRQYFELLWQKANKQ